MTAAHLRCKVGDLAIVGFHPSSHNNGAVVRVVERMPDLKSGKPAWHVRSEGSLLTAVNDDGSMEELSELWMADCVLTPICPGKPIKARRARKPVEAA